MAQSNLVKFRFRPGGKEKWLRWCEELKRRAPEVQESLRAEAVQAEACFLAEDGEHVFYFIQAENLAHSHQVSAASPRPIDRQHKMEREGALEFISNFPALFQFDQGVAEQGENI